jgi:hypothetical protein
MQKYTSVLERQRTDVISREKLHKIGPTRFIFTLAQNVWNHNEQFRRIRITENSAGNA